MLQLFQQFQEIIHKSIRKELIMLLKEIPLTAIENIKIGHAQDYKHATGCTVILCEKGAPAGVDVRGGGPASRETELLNPIAACEGIHALLLSGGSAFGLDAAGGVMEYLEEKNVGFDVGVTKVPLVCASCIFDLALVSHNVRPTKEMAYEACKNAELNNPEMGAVGAGTGATVGKFYGQEYAMKSGLGMYAVTLGDLKVGAIVTVNALGDIFDFETGEQIAGLLSEDKKHLRSSETEFYRSYAKMKNLFTGNTTIGAIITNGKFTKTEMKKIASMAQNGYARAIRPVHTTADGDSIYALSVGEVSADLNVTGTLASHVMAMAIKKAVEHTKPMYGLKAMRDLLMK